MSKLEAGEFQSRTQHPRKKTGKLAKIDKNEQKYARFEPFFSTPPRANLRAKSAGRCVTSGSGLGEIKNQSSNGSTSLTILSNVEGMQNYNAKLKIGLRQRMKLLL